MCSLDKRLFWYLPWNVLLLDLPIPIPFAHSSLRDLAQYVTGIATCLSGAVSNGDQPENCRGDEHNACEFSANGHGALHEVVDYLVITFTILTHYHSLVLGCAGVPSYGRSSEPRGFKPAPS